MKKVFSSLVGVFLLTALFAHLSFAQGYQGKGKIRGYVYDENGRPLEKVKVKLFCLKAASGFTTETDKNGEWRALWIRGGQWNLDFEKVGYEPKKISLEVNEWGKNPDIVIKLRKIEGLIVTDEIKEALEKGNQLFDEKRYEEAIKVFEEIIQREPEAFIIYLNIGHCYFQMERYEQAIENYQKVLARQGDNKNALIGIGNAYLNMGKKEEALAWYSKIKFEDIDDPIVLYNMGNSFYEHSMYEESVKYYERAIKLQNDFLEARYRLGLAYIALGKNEAALQEFETYLKYDSESERAGQVRGFIEYLKKKEMKGKLSSIDF
ncbi:MAG: tetratricopeptide repeat protein [Candidatus Aminicenantes bacterium]|nr:tetratricopeptide repeat protein [Candidatus Aminicenantes bacterium]